MKKGKFKNDNNAKSGHYNRLTNLFIIIVLIIIIYLFIYIYLFTYRTLLK